MDTSASERFDGIDKQVICEMLDARIVDSDMLVKIVQLMTIPQFKAFFVALAEIELIELDSAACALRECARRLRRSGPDTYNIAQVAAEGLAG